MIYQQSPLIQTIDDVFSTNECQAFIDLSHQHDYEIAHINVARGVSEVRTEVRNNQRVIYESHDLAAQIFARVKRHLPEWLHNWQLEGLNERFRFYLYEHGQTITPKQGQILLFEHRQLHEGAPVISGQKYVLRTDVMYHYQPLVMR